MTIFILIGALIAAVTIAQMVVSKTIRIPRGLRNVAMVYVFWSVIIGFIV
jgi:hypothetical protein